jgi:PAS domain S-box-containing protein
MQERTGQVATSNNELFHDAFNASPIGIAVENLEGQPLFANRSLCSMLGFTEEELRGKHCVDFSPPEDAEKDWALFQQLRAGSIDHYQLEKRYFRRDGSLVWGRLSLSLLNSRPSPLVVAMVEDITDKRTAEEAVRASEERLRLAQQVAGIGTFERNLQTGTVTWTPEMESLYGLPPGGFGQTHAAFENLIHPDDRARVMKLVDGALKTGQPTMGEWRVLWPDGSIHWIAGRWQVFMNESDEPFRVVGANMDVTGRKRTEETLWEVNRSLEAHATLLQSREELLKIFVKHVPAAVAMLDRDMRYLQVSDRWRADFGFGNTEMLGRSHYEIFPDLPDRWKQLHRRALAGETLRAEEDRWDRQGATTWLRWEIRPWQNPDGLPGGILIFSEDITRRKQIEEALSEIPRKLIEAQEQERARIGRELHDDVNQRLAMLAIELERVQENWPELPSDVRSRMQELRKQVGEISNDVQVLSHELHSAKLEYLGVVKGMRSWCKEFADKQGMEIEFKGVEGLSSLPPEVSLCLFRVLQEALHNVAKHSGVRQIEVQLREDSGELHLVVSDSGSGFDLETALQGPGLGLTSMRERVRLVDGIIEIQSKPMGGTAVHVRIPLRSEPAPQRAAG